MKFERPTPEQALEQDFKALDDSVTTIAAAIKAKDDDSADTVKRNVDHIAHMLKKDEIAGAGKDLKSYEDAIASGEAFLAAQSK